MSLQIFFFEDIMCVHNVGFPEHFWLILWIFSSWRAGVIFCGTSWYIFKYIKSINFLVNNQILITLQDCFFCSYPNIYIIKLSGEQFLPLSSYQNWYNFLLITEMVQYEWKVKYQGRETAAIAGRTYKLPGLIIRKYHYNRTLHYVIERPYQRLLHSLDPIQKMTV